MSVGRKLATALLGLAAAFSPASMPGAHAASDTTSTFTPGSAWTDTSGNTLQMHGLGIVKSGATWYAFGEDKTGESSGSAPFQDIPCYSSADLHTWTRQGTALTRQASGDLGPNRIVERPKVVRNPSTGMYVMYMHIDNSDYSDRKVGVADSTTPCGPYTYRGSFRPLGNESLDIGLFQDADGSAYLLSDDRPNGLRVYRLSSDYESVASAVSMPLPTGYEAPAMVHVGSTYYLLASHQSGWNTNDNVYVSAPGPAGPWSAPADFAPVGTNTYHTQTANIIPVGGTQGTAYIYAGDDWNLSDLGSSHLVWLPMTVSGTTVNVGWQRSWTLDVTAGTWTGTSNPASGATDRLTNANSGLVLDVSGKSTADGGPVVQWADNGGGNQRWTLDRLSGNVYTLVNANSGKCLDVPNQSTASGVQLDQWSCNNGPNQMWAIDSVGSYTSSSDTTYQLVALNSGLAVDVTGGSTSNGAAVIQWPGNGGANQHWTIG